MLPLGLIFRHASSLLAHRKRWRADWARPFGYGATPRPAVWPKRKFSHCSAADCGFAEFFSFGNVVQLTLLQIGFCRYDIIYE